MVWWTSNCFAFGLSSYILHSPICPSSNFIIEMLTWTWLNVLEAFFGGICCSFCRKAHTESSGKILAERFGENIPFFGAGFGAFFSAFFGEQLSASKSGKFAKNKRDPLTNLARSVTNCREMLMAFCAALILRNQGNKVRHVMAKCCKIQNVLVTSSDATNRYMTCFDTTELQSCFHNVSDVDKKLLKHSGLLGWPCLLGTSCTIHYNNRWCQLVSMSVEGCAWIQLAPSPQNTSSTTDFETRYWFECAIPTSEPAFTTTRMIPCC